MEVGFCDRDWTKVTASDRLPLDKPHLYCDKVGIDVKQHCQNYASIVYNIL